MRNLSFCDVKWDKRYFAAFIVTLVCSIICGIVLCKLVTTNTYLRNLTCEYVYNVFNFNSGTLFVARLLVDLLFFYAVFLLCYLTKLKYVTLALFFLKGLFFGVYTVILVGVNAFGGVLVAVFVFVPSSLVSIAAAYVIAEFCRIADKKYACFAPAVLSLADAVVLLLLVNVLFRVVIAIA